MIKFILEVDEQFIRENSDFSNLLDRAKDNSIHRDALDEIFLALTIAALEGRIDKGEKEFVVRQEDLVEERDKSLFEKSLVIAATLSMQLSKAKQANDELP